MNGGEWGIDELDLSRFADPAGDASDFTAGAPVTLTGQWRARELRMVVSPQLPQDWWWLGPAESVPGLLDVTGDVVEGDRVLLAHPDCAERALTSAKAALRAWHGAG